MPVNCVGNALLKVCEKEIEINNVLHVPDLVANLLSVQKIVEKGNNVSFDKNGCVIRNSENVNRRTVYTNYVKAKNQFVDLA